MVFGINVYIRMETIVLERLFYEATGQPASTMNALTASGSHRRYYRLCSADGAVSLIGVEGTSEAENKAFIYMADHFERHGLNVPHVVAVSDDKMAYLQEDKGDLLLFDYIAAGRKTGVFSEEEKQMLRRTIQALARLQTKGAEGFDFQQCYPQPEFNLRSILWDLHYFKYCFLQATGVDFQEDRLEDEFERLAYILLENRMDTFMYRDFQSRNVMLVESRESNGGLVPCFIDFQGGRRGPVHYDVASFLWQAKANFSPRLREELIDVYLDELQHYISVNRTDFRDRLHHFVLFRTLQVLGAYGFRGYFEKKPHFLQSIPFAIANLRELLSGFTDDYPYMTEVLRRMTEMQQFKDMSVRHPLVVRVYSFSYKKGIPSDSSGNGGGYVFDCRAVNNPGKYERYAHFTGLDEPVKRFIEEDGEMRVFLEATYRLVDASVKRYMERGFEHLMVSYGCTGGQHRSVYAAEHLAHHINETFGVEVRIIHREQNKEIQLKAK